MTGVVVGTLPHEHPFVSLKNVAHNVNVVGQMVEPDGTRHPGLVTRTFGRGRVIYFCGHPESKYQFWSHGDSPIEPGRLWTDNRNSDYGQLICAAALAGGSPPMRVENLPEGVLAETYKHENRDLKGVQVRLANLEGGRMKTDIVPVWYGIGFPDLKPRLPQPDQPIRVTVRAIGVRNVYLVSPDYESIVRLAPKQSGDQVTVTLPNVHRYSMLYFEQAGDLLKTLGTTASKSIPAARSLVMEESVPLVGAFVPGSSTAFAGSEEMHGGSEPSIYLGEMSRFIYGSQTTNTKVGMTLKIADTIPNPILEIGGMEAAAPIKILLNGKVVYEGSNTFVADRWTTKTFPIPANTLTTGDNSVEIQNTGHGPVSAVPWFGVSYVRLRSEQK